MNQTESEASMISRQQSLTQGCIWKGILLFALPIFLGNVFQQFYNTFDSWVVGNYLGDDALAAVSSSGSLIFMMIGFFGGVAEGAGVLIARYFGAKDHKAMRKAIHTDIAMGLTVGVFLTVLGIIFIPTVLRWMGTPQDVFPQSVEYFRYYFAGALFVVLYNTCQGILHAVGDSRHPLIYLIISSILNVVLDLLFVGVFHWGVWSAALATTLSQGISALLSIIRLIRCKESYQVNIKEIRFHRSSLRLILKYGIPAGIQNSVIGFANLFVQTNINSFGKAAMAGCGSYSKLEGFAFLPITCFAQALSTFVGQNLGACQQDRVRKGARFGILCCITSAEIIGVLSWIFAPQLIGIFNDSSDVILFGSRHMRTICLFYFLLAFSHCIAGILRGAGKSAVPMFIMLSCWCVIRVTYISIALSFVNELTTVSWAYPITWNCSSLVFLIYYRKAHWSHAFEEPLRKA